MNSIKKLTAVFLAVLMLMSLAVIGAYAEDEDYSTWYAVGDSYLFGANWAAAPQNQMTKVNGVYTVTIPNVDADEYSFKVIEITPSSETVWHPDGMGNDSKVEVTEDGSTVRICLVPTGDNSSDVPYAEVFAPGQEIPEITAPSEPETEPETEEPVPEGTLKVNVKNNINSAVISESYDTTATNKFTLSFNLTSVPTFANIQGYFTYDSSVIELVDCALSSQFEAPVVNTNLYNQVTFNSTSDDNSADFTEGGAFLTAEFKIHNTGETNIELYIDELNGLNQDYKTYGIISGGVAVRPDDISVSADVFTPAEPTEPTEATEPTTPAPATSIKVSAAKTMYVGATTTVKATVTNGVGKTTFKSSNTKVATVTSAGKVTAKKAGSVTITATNNGKSASAKITINKKANTIKVKTKTATVTAKKGGTIKKAKAFTITGAKGTVTFKKVSGDKKISINKKTGNITVKKGLKKNKSYKFKVKVTAAGTTAFKAGSKTVTVTIKTK